MAANGAHGARGGLVDTRQEMKITKHSGSEKDWAVWALRFEAYTGLLGFEDAMSTAANMQQPVRIDEMNEESLEISKALWYLLVSYTDGKSIGVVRLAGKHNGLEAWRALKLEFEGNQGGRFTAMLRLILNP
jgi:hypothetical protein